MHVREWMTRDPVTVSPKETVVLARAILRQRGIRHLPMMDGDWCPAYDHPRPISFGRECLDPGYRHAYSIEEYRDKIVR